MKCSHAPSRRLATLGILLLGFTASTTLAQANLDYQDLLTNAGMCTHQLFFRSFLSENSTRQLGIHRVYHWHEPVDFIRQDVLILSTGDWIESSALAYGKAAWSVMSDPTEGFKDATVSFTSIDQQDLSSVLESLRSRPESHGTEAGETLLGTTANASSALESVISPPRISPPKPSAAVLILVAGASFIVRHRRRFKSAGTARFRLAI